MWDFSLFADGMHDCRNTHTHTHVFFPLSVCCHVLCLSLSCNKAPFISIAQEILRSHSASHNIVFTVNMFQIHERGGGRGFSPYGGIPSRLLLVIVSSVKYRNIFSLLCTIPKISIPKKIFIFFICVNCHVTINSHLKHLEILLEIKR